MLYGHVDNDPQLVDHGELMDNISQIESGDNSPQSECNIHPTQDKSKKVSLYKQNFMIISKSAGIEQFKQGLLSVSSQFPKSGCCLEKYFVENQKCLTYYDVRSQIAFSIKQLKKGVMQLSAKKTQLLSLNFTSCHLSTVKMVFLERLAICHSN